MTISGENGEIRVGDRVVADRTEWSLRRSRDYIDAEAFGPDNKAYLIPRPEVSGTFATQGDEMILGGIPAPGPIRMKLYNPAVPAWWGRLKHRLLKTEWPTYVFAEFDALYDYNVRDEPGEESVIEGSFNAVGQTTIYDQPLSRLERIWHRICSTIKRSH